MQKNIIAQGRGTFHLYEADLIGTDYMGSNMTQLTGTANLFFVEGEGCVVEIDKTDAAVKFIENDKTYGMLFVDVLNKDDQQMYQVFLMTPVESGNPNKLKFKLTKYKNKQAMGWSMRGRTYDDFVNNLSKDALYIIDRY